VTVKIQRGGFVHAVPEETRRQKTKLEISELE
jgi:hypothetical protein